ncbi:hypothetical protein CCP3SC15_410016 [Gammaproteobacteria bacterium]
MAVASSYPEARRATFPTGSAHPHDGTDVGLTDAVGTLVAAGVFPELGTDRLWRSGTVAEGANGALGSVAAVGYLTLPRISRACLHGAYIGAGFLCGLYCNVLNLLVAMGGLEPPTSAL